jgi:hypothetical protein
MPQQIGVSKSSDRFGVILQLPRDQLKELVGKQVGMHMLAFTTGLILGPINQIKKKKTCSHH